MSAENWGGSAAATGIEFQAAVSALCMVHMACGMPLGWSASGNDTPMSVSAETGGPGDDIALQLADGRVVEVQAKLKLKADERLWTCLIALCQSAQENAHFFGVLAVGPATSVAIRDQLARDMIRIGQGRTDDLSPLAITLTQKLVAVSISNSACAKVQIQTIHVLEQDGASAQSAVAHLAKITTLPGQAWELLKAEGLRLVKLRGRQNTASLSGVIPGLREITAGSIGPSIVARQLLSWTLEKTEFFTIPVVDKKFSLDEDWIELKAHSLDKADVSLESIEKALARYHEGPSAGGARRHRDSFDAETLGYFSRHCVIVAGPGMGKTQLLRRIARLLARKREPSLIVRLRPLAKRLRLGETFLEAALHIGLDASPFRPSDLQTLGMQNVTLLLDGLDESGSEQEAIAEAAVSLAASYTRCRIVFTTRPIGYETALLSAWKHYELTPIEASNAKRGVVGLVNAALSEGNAQVKAATYAAVSYLDYKRDQRFSASSPLLIALLASLALNEVIAAPTKDGLYGQLFKLIERMATAKSAATSVTPALRNAFLQQLGWEVNEQPYVDAEQVLAACAQRLAVELNEPQLKARLICDEAFIFWEEVGIVERVRFKVNESLTFVHKTFGEYAAAQYLLSRKVDERTYLLSKIEPNQQWNEVVIFAAAMGSGRELVQLVLQRADQSQIGITRLLRWIKHSKDPLDENLSKAVLQKTWSVIEAPHSGEALRVGVDLVAALDQLPGAAGYSFTYRSNNQWWTALVGWSCFVRTSPQSLDFSALLAFLDSYAQAADTRTLSSGFSLHSPRRDIWEGLLLASIREAMLREGSTEARAFIDRLKSSRDAQKMGFLGDLKFILKEAGVDVEIAAQEDFLSKYFGPEFLAEGKQDMLALLHVIAEDSSACTESADTPLLELSAFWYGTDLIFKEVDAAALAVKAPGGKEARQIVKMAARLSAYNYGQLVVEAQTKISALEKPDSLEWRFDGLLAVDAPLEWRGNPDSSAKGVIKHGLLHASDWIVVLAANLAEHLLNATDVDELIPQVLAKSNGVGVAAAAYLSLQFLSKERARELMVARLKQPLNRGCQYLFKYLVEVWTPELENDATDILTPALSFGPRTAKAALLLGRASSEAYRDTLVRLLKDAYDYWLENEEPLPTGSGVIPESPRGDILALMIEKCAVSQDELFVAVRDGRSDVSRPAKDALLVAFSKSEAARNELVRRIQAGELFDHLLSDCLRARISFSEQDVQSIAALLESNSPQTRLAAASILDGQYMPREDIRRWAEKLVHDPYQRLRDKGHASLAALKDLPGDELAPVRPEPWIRYGA